MTQSNFLELAKQGDARAIAALINRSLQPRGINAKTALKNGCLQIMLESPQVPEQQVLMAFVYKGITSLEAESIKRVKVYGRQIGEAFPDWHQEFELAAQPSSAIPLAKTSSVHFDNRLEDVKTKANQASEKNNVAFALSSIPSISDF